MKNLICLLTVFLAVACSPGSSSFEKAISDYKQTEPKTGKLYDLKFKMIETGEPQQVTVADSLKILEAEAKEAKNKELESVRYLLSISEKGLANEKGSKAQSKTMVDIHEKNIRKYKEQIAGIENRTGVIDAAYADRKPDEVLANVLVCTYSMNDLFGNNFTEKSEFVLSPDGVTVYEARRIRE
jgi:hypothetical protein